MAIKEGKELLSVFTYNIYSVFSIMYLRLVSDKIDLANRSAAFIESYIVHNY